VPRRRAAGRQANLNDAVTRQSKSLDALCRLGRSMWSPGDVLCRHFLPLSPPSLHTRCFQLPPSRGCAVRSLGLRFLARVVLACAGPCAARVLGVPRRRAAGRQANLNDAVTRQSKSLDALYRLGRSIGCMRLRPTHHLTTATPAMAVNTSARPRVFSLRTTERTHPTTLSIHASSLFPPPPSLFPPPSSFSPCHLIGLGTRPRSPPPPR
jgi:hypothetical protein